MNKFYYCHNHECGIVMLRAEWMTGDYCWSCRAVLGRNWKKPPKVKEKGGLNEMQK